MKPVIYLAGPISGMTLNETRSWRSYVEEKLGDDVECLCPLRGKEFLYDVGIIEGSYPYHELSTDKAIMGRDFSDAALQADALFVNFAGANRVSIGTCFELAWAYQLHKPVIVIMEEENNLHEHPFVRQAATYRTPYIDVGINITKHLFNRG